MFLVGQFNFSGAKKQTFPENLKELFILPIFRSIPPLNPFSPTKIMGSKGQFYKHFR